MKFINQSFLSNSFKAFDMFRDIYRIDDQMNKNQRVPCKNLFDNLSLEEVRGFEFYFMR